MAGSVFLTDAISPRTLAACRSLGRHNLKVTCADETRFNLTFFSRYCRERVIYPSIRDKPRAFVSTLLAFLNKNPHECLIPVKEPTLDIVLTYRQAFERVTRVPFVDNATFQICRDKSKTMDLADRTGVPYPLSVVPSGPGQVLAESHLLRFPLVIKPCSSCAGEGIRHVYKKQELLETYCMVHERYPLPLVQEEIPLGEKYDVCCLFDEESQPVATFVQREVRCFPLRDGPSTVQESVWRPDLVDLTVQMLQKIGWYGLAEAEFIIDPRDGTPKLMEINPRLWGSLQLAIQCGVDFPYLLYQLARGERIEPVHQYPVGQMCRQLLPYDILHFLANPNRFRLQPSFFDFFNAQCGYSLLSTRDPGPILGFFFACGRYLFDADMWRDLARVELVANRLSALLRRRPTKAPVVSFMAEEPSLQKEPAQVELAQVE